MPSRADDVVTFVDPGQEDVAEVDGPDAIVDFLEAEDLLRVEVLRDISRRYGLARIVR